MTYISVLFSVAFLIIGFISGWFICEKYIALMEHERHDFEELFEQNPHPEIFTETGEINRGDYFCIQFEPGYDPSDFSPDDIVDQ